MSGRQTTPRSHEQDWLRRVGVIIVELHDGYPLKEFEKDTKCHGLRVITPEDGCETRMIVAMAEVRQ